MSLLRNPLGYSTRRARRRHRYARTVPGAQLDGDLAGGGHRPSQYAKQRTIHHVANSEALSDDLLDRLFLALGDASRRSIVAQLGERGALSVSEASAQLLLSPAGITKHVRVLEDAGLVTRRLEGRRHVLSLEAQRLLLAEDWIERYREMWTHSLARLATLAAELDEGDNR